MSYGQSGFCQAQQTVRSNHTAQCLCKGLEQQVKGWGVDGGGGGGFSGPGIHLMKGRRPCEVPGAPFIVRPTCRVHGHISALLHGNDTSYSYRMEDYWHVLVLDGGES